MSLNWLLFIFIILSGGVSFYLKRKYPATIWLGVTFIGFLFSLGILVVALFSQNNITAPLYILVFLLGSITLLVPLIMIGSFLGNGIKIIRKEGFRFANTLSLMIGIGLVFYLIYWPMMTDLSSNHLLNNLYRWFSFAVVYLSYILIFYAVANFLNLWHVKVGTFDYFIVLGARIINGQVTPILAQRIDRALSIQKEDGKGKFVFSGGQGADEARPEGEAMADYAHSKGIQKDQILTETASKSTTENIKNSKKIIDADWKADRKPRIALVTNNYHLLRALMLAKEQGVDTIGFGSKTKFYYSLNAFLREFVAYLTMTYKIHMIIIGSVGALLFLVY